MFTVDKHCSDVRCDEFLVPQTDRKSKQVKEHSDTENYICDQYEEKLAILDMWTNNKVGKDKNAICLHFSISAEILLFNLPR